MHQPISRKAELYKPRNGEAGTETCRVVKPSSVKTKEPPSPCGFTYGIAVYGPVCTVVWEGRAGNRSPYPDNLPFNIKISNWLATENCAPNFHGYEPENYGTNPYRELPLLSKHL